MFFATSQNNRGEYLADGKSPHLCRKFSSPPPLSLSRTSSPARTRKLSLTSPLNSRIGALDLSASSVASSPTSNYSPATSPPPTGPKAPLDLSRGLSSPEQSPGSAEDSLENPRLDLCNKLRRSIRRGIPYPQSPGTGSAAALLGAGVGSLFSQPCCSFPGTAAWQRHRVTEWSRWEGSSKLILFQPTAPCLFSLLCSVREKGRKEYFMPIVFAEVRNF